MALTFIIGLFAQTLRPVRMLRMFTYLTIANGGILINYLGCVFYNPHQRSLVQAKLVFVSAAKKPSREIYHFCAALSRNFREIWSKLALNTFCCYNMLFPVTQTLFTCSKVDKIDQQPATLPWTDITTFNVSNDQLM